MESSLKTTDRQPGVFQAILTNEMFLAALVTVMTIFTAVAAYQGSLASGDSLKNFFIAQSALTDASLLYVEGGQAIFYDQSAYDQAQLSLHNEDLDAAAYFLDQLSEPGAAAVSRIPDDYPFDAEYEKAMYAEAIATVEDADDAYDQAIIFNVIGDRLGLVTTVLAVGLAFAAWAALAPADSRQRQLFALLGLISLIAGAIEYFRIMAGG
jgi:hypothetical protein